MTAKRQPLRGAAVGQLGREVGTHDDEREQAEQDHRRRQVGGDPLAGVARVNGDLAQVSLKDRQQQRRDRRDDE
jgi:hypothetical protein